MILSTFIGSERVRAIPDTGDFLVYIERICAFDLVPRSFSISKRLVGKHCTCERLNFIRNEDFCVGPCVGGGRRRSCCRSSTRQRWRAIDNREKVRARQDLQRRLQYVLLQRDGPPLLQPVSLSGTERGTTRGS